MDLAWPKRIDYSLAGGPHGVPVKPVSSETEIRLGFWPVLRSVKPRQNGTLIFGGPLIRGRNVSCAGDFPQGHEFRICIADAPRFLDRDESVTISMYEENGCAHFADPVYRGDGTEIETITPSSIQQCGLHYWPQEALGHSWVQGVTFSQQRVAGRHICTGRVGHNSAERSAEG